ncbi:hypothetical protein [Maricaulis salignorans]|uniref:hypothetical protein n=1 Tax=Maricaulis salignorans TaxID=144026 RepID=UPI00115F9AA0|nr:hypothetical protein [Maricaulis salignorans]
MKNSFTFLVNTVLLVSLSCGAGAFAIAILAIFLDSPFFEPLFNAAAGLFTFGVGAIFGLIGGAHRSETRDS